MGLLLCCPSVRNVHEDNQILPEYLIVDMKGVCILFVLGGVYILKPQFYTGTAVLLCLRGLKVSGQKKYYRVTSFTKSPPNTHGCGFSVYSIIIN